MEMRFIANIFCYSQHYIYWGLDSLYKKGGIFKVISIPLIVFFLFTIGGFITGVAILLDKYASESYQKREDKVYGECSGIEGLPVSIFCIAINVPFILLLFGINIYD